MATVYHAYDQVLQSDVALKVFPRDSLSERAIERIRREVEASRMIASPALVRYHDIHFDSNSIILSMEFLEYGTLQNRLDREGPLSETEIRPILSQLLPALSSLHEAGIVHRDIKPANIFLTKDGSIKLGDFGIVHLSMEEGVTQTGETLGTPTHMAPEQFAGEQIGPPCDYYALGITIYHLLTANPPVTGTYGSIASAHLEHRIPSLPQPLASFSLRRLLRGLLQRNPEQRLGKKAIQRYLLGHGPRLLPQEKALLRYGFYLLALTALSILIYQNYFSPKLTDVAAEGRTIRGYAHNRLLWTRTLPFPVLGCTLADHDGDKDPEIFPTYHISHLLGENRPSYWVLGSDGSDLFPLQIDIRWISSYFSLFPRNYIVEPLIVRSSDGHEPDIFIRIRHLDYYPCALYYLPAGSSHAETLSIHSGVIYDIARLGNRFVLYGFSNRLLHNAFVAVTDPVTDRETPLLSVVDDVNHYTFKHIRSYHLIGNAPNLFRLKRDRDRLLVQLDQNRTVTILPDGSLDGMEPDADTETLNFLYAYQAIQEIYRQRKFDKVEQLSTEESRRAAALELEGYAALFDSLSAEALFSMNRRETAIQRCLTSASQFPDYSNDLYVRAGLFAYMAGDYAAARKIWEDSSYLINKSRREEIQSFSLYALMLQGQVGEAMTILDNLIPNVPRDNIWQQYRHYQKGWGLLLSGRDREAMDFLRPVLRQPDLYHHAIAFFLAAYRSGSLDPKLAASFQKSAGCKNIELDLISALTRGNPDETRQILEEIRENQTQDPDNAILYPLIMKVLSFQ